MPWREVCPMDERVRFVAAVLAAEQSMTRLCESFGISRKSGYKWLARHREHGAAGLYDLSRAPHRAPWAIPAAAAQAILGVRPSAGPSRLCRLPRATGAGVPRVRAAAHDALG